MFYGNCLICSQRLNNDHIFCDDCSRFALVLKRKCSKCGGFSIVDGVNGCPSCNGRKIWFDSIFSAYIYCGSVSNVISKMKYGKNRSYAEILGEHLSSFLISEKLSGKTIVFPPMNFFDKFKRSFNQSEILAEKISLIHNLEIRKNLIKKIKKTKPQASLSYNKRLTNLKGAFQIREPVKNIRFLIVDDVCTTFSTVNSIAEALKKEGAKEVAVATLARTSPYFS
jgi:competence protein ComFC